MTRGLLPSPRAIGLAWRVVVAGPVVAAVLAFSAVRASGEEPARVRWYAVNAELDARGNSLRLGDGAQPIALRGGWSCVVGAASTAWPLFEARQTVCGRAGDAFEFSVSCDPRRRREHVQIRFRGADGRPVDFVEVGCEVLGAAP
jgi:hypothetical protein